jgi:hypothetical protein
MRAKNIIKNRQMDSTAGGLGGYNRDIIRIENKKTMNQTTDTRQHTGLSFLLRSSAPRKGSRFEINRFPSV